MDLEFTVSDLDCMQIEDLNEVLIIEGPSNVDSLVLPDKVNYDGKDYKVSVVSEEAFTSAELQSVYIPSTVRSIELSAFSFCENLKEVKGGDNLILIDDFAFYKCENLTAINLPYSLIAIGISAFRGCTKLTEIIIPSYVKSIGKYAFDDCPNLKSIIICNDEGQVNIAEDALPKDIEPKYIGFQPHSYFIDKQVISSNKEVENKFNNTSKVLDKYAVFGEYMVQIMQDDSVRVGLSESNVKAALRQLAGAVNFNYDASWTTRQFGSKIIKQFGNGDMATVGGEVVLKEESGSIRVFNLCKDIDSALKTVAKQVGYSFDSSLSASQKSDELGAALINFLKTKK